MHYANEKFSNKREDGLVYEEVKKVNAQMFKQSIDFDKTIARELTLSEGDHIERRPIHIPHLGNLYVQKPVTKLMAYHILSSRDNIQGGEFRFNTWGDPARKDNFGKDVISDNPYPIWLNEQGSLFIVSALETVGTYTVVSGELKVVMYEFIGDNYK